MNCFVINLEKDTDRKKHMIEQLSDLMPYSFFDAINIRKITNNEIAFLYDDDRANRELGRSLRQGEIGCALSHFEIFKKMIEQNMQGVFIFEDDVVVDKRFFGMLEKISQSDYEYITFNYTIFTIKNIKLFFSDVLKEGGLYNCIKKLLLLVPAIFADLFFQMKGNFLTPGIAKRFKPLYFTGGYYISYLGAKKLLGIHDKVFLPADILPEKYRKLVKLKTGFIYPLLVEQLDAFESNIQIS